MIDPNDTLPPDPYASTIPSPPPEDCGDDLGYSLDVDDEGNPVAIIALDGPAWKRFTDLAHGRLDFESFASEALDEP